MPRGYLKTIEYALTDLVGIIRQEMRKQGISQSEVASQIGVSQSAFSQKLAKESLTAKEVIVIVRFLKIPSAVIGGIVCGDR